MSNKLTDQEKSYISILIEADKETVAMLNGFAELTMKQKKKMRWLDNLKKKIQEL